MKRCSKCEQDKSLDEFWKHSRGRDGRQAECISCMQERRRVWKKKNPNYSREWYQRNRETEAAKQQARKYGLDPQAVNDMFLSQGGQCAACFDALGDGHWRHIDHCHATGRVRGILCRHCNTALGFFNEDPAKLHALANYVERHHASLV